MIRGLFFCISELKLWITDDEQAPSVSLAIYGKLY